MNAHVDELLREIASQKTKEKLNTIQCVIEELKSTEDLRQNNNYVNSTIAKLQQKQEEVSGEINTLLDEKQHPRGASPPPPDLENIDAKILLRQSDLIEIAEDIELLQKKLNDKNNKKIEKNPFSSPCSFALGKIKEEKLSGINQSIKILDDNLNQVMMNIEKLATELSPNGIYLWQRLNALLLSKKAQQEKAQKIIKLKPCLKKQLSFLGEIYNTTCWLYYYKKMFGGDSDTNEGAPSWQSVVTKYKEVYEHVQNRLLTLPKADREMVAGDNYAMFADLQDKNEDAENTQIPSSVGSGEKIPQPLHPFNLPEQKKKAAT